MVVGRQYISAIIACLLVVLVAPAAFALEQEPDLVSKWDYFYERSLGCVGILKDWLTRALRDALEEENKTITQKHLKQRAWSIAQCTRMLQEIQEGEQQLEETEEDVSEFRELLGIDPETIEETLKTTAKSTKRSNRVGQRKAKRDPIGVSQNA